MNTSVKSTLGDYISVKDRLPECVELPNAFGVQVEVIPPLLGSVTYYGCRVTDKPAFYRYGAVVKGITHWRYADTIPVETDEHGRYAYHTRINPVHFWQALQEKAMELQRGGANQAAINPIYAVLNSREAIEALVDVASSVMIADEYWRAKQKESLTRDMSALKASIAEFDRIVKED